jgi:hypothetical protein
LGDCDGVPLAYGVGDASAQARNASCADGKVKRRLSTGRIIELAEV